MRLTDGGSWQRVLWAAVVGALLSSEATAAERYNFEHEFVLGTSLQIQVDADSPEAASKAEGRVLAEIARLEKIFSSYSADSELVRWQATPAPATSAQATPLSPELLQVLAASDRWRALSGGAFNPAVKAATDLWKKAETRQQVPTDNELAAVCAQIAQPSWKLSPAAGTGTRLTAGPLTLDAIAKGTIIDRAVSAALTGRSDVRGLVVNIGGDLRVAGQITTTVQIADPFHDAINAAPLASIQVHEQGVATSGGYRRGFQIAGKRYSHLIDPRTAQPVDHFASVTVVAPTAETADALATTFSILTASECRALAAQLTGVEYLLIAKDGRQTASAGWHELLEPRLARFAQAAAAQATALQAGEAPAKEPAKQPAAGAVELLELEVKFELSKPTGAQYRRPYVAMWLEDSDGFPVKTTVLWMMTKQPGPRWHRDLLRWFRNDRTRKLADQRELIGVISEATRGPGEYKAVFDGKDDAGQPLKPGKYTLYLEVAREHGTYQLITHPLELGAQPIAEAKLKSNVEIKSASVEYRPRASSGGKPAP